MTFEKCLGTLIGYSVKLYKILLETYSGSALDGDWTNGSQDEK